MYLIMCVVMHIHMYVLRACRVMNVGAILLISTLSIGVCVSEAKVGSLTHES